MGQLDYKRNICVSSIDSLLSGIILYSTCTALYEGWPTSLTGSTQQTGNLSVLAAFDGFCSFLQPSTEICHIWLIREDKKSCLKYCQKFNAK